MMMNVVRCIVERVRVGVGKTSSNVLQFSSRKSGKDHDSFLTHVLRFISSCDLRRVSEMRCRLDFVCSSSASEDI